METEGMKHARILTATILFGAACTGCLTDPDLKVPYTGFAPSHLSDGWEISAPEAVGMDRDRLEQVYRRLFAEDLFPTVRSLLVVRHGKLVAEGYSRDFTDRDTYQNLQSATKSITSLLMGMAMEEGMADSLDEPLYDLIPGHFDDDARKRSITLRDVLTMRTGLKFHNEDDSGPFFHTSGSSVANILHRPLESYPGTTFYYNDGTPQLISGIFMEKMGVTLEAFASQRLFGPLGIRVYQWEKHADGLSFGAYGLWLLPRDMARIGQMVLQGGEWEGRQIVPSTWLEESTRIYANGDYGYYWWVLAEGQVYYASGAGGQRILVDEKEDLVIVLTGDPGSKNWILTSGTNTLFDGIYESIVGW
jgi:CubicO group peptidase (beta-lactamase class C family)